jgi:chaperonin GroES
MSRLDPLNGFIILKPIEEQEQLSGNIIIPDLGKEKPEIGEVVATSPTYNYNSDIEVESKLQIGDKVLIPKLGSQRLVVEGEEFYITKETDILAIIKN